VLPTSTQSMAAYAEMRERLTGALTGLSDETAASTPVITCPGWSVTDLAAHVYGVPRDVTDGNISEAGTPGWTSEQVARFAPMGLTALVAGWNRISPDFEAKAAHLPDPITARIAFDAGVHEHDVLGALGCPGSRESATVLIGLEFMTEGMAGQVDQAGLPGVEFVTPAFHATLGNGPVRVRLETDTFTLYRALTGRRSLSQINSLPWEGDPGPYLTVFDGSPLAPAAVEIVE
jgi:uncharacterized protein (TIGR03083 family)